MISIFGSTNLVCNPLQCGFVDGIYIYHNEYGKNDMLNDLKRIEIKPFNKIFMKNLYYFYELYIYLECRTKNTIIE